MTYWSIYNSASGHGIFFRRILSYPSSDMGKGLNPAVLSPTFAEGDLRRKRGRPKADEIEIISRDILNAAQKAFFESSFEDVTIDAIIARAGVKKNTLFKRFPNKRALLQAVLSEKLAEWTGQSEPSLSSVEGVIDRMTVLAGHILRQARSVDIRKCSHLAELAWPGVEALSFRHELLGYDRTVDRLCDEIEKACAEEGRAIENPRFVATALMSVLTVWADTVGRRADVDDAEISNFADTAVKLLFWGCFSKNA